MGKVFVILSLHSVTSYDFSANVGESKERNKKETKTQINIFITKSMVLLSEEHLIHHKIRKSTTFQQYSYSVNIHFNVAFICCCNCSEQTHYQTELKEFFSFVTDIIILKSVFMMKMFKMLLTKQKSLNFLCIHYRNSKCI